MRNHNYTTHSARAEQRSDTHKAGSEDAAPARSKRKELRLGLFNVKAQKCWMFPALKTLFQSAALTCLLLFSSCAEKDQPPTTEERLHGAWQRNWMGFTNRYNFHDGACDVYAIVPAQPVQYYAYAYSTNGDTLTMLDLAGGDVTKAVVGFPTDTTAVFLLEGGILYFLKRIQ